ncbi:MASE1 domain-containing protein [Sandarakinorhabdus rubra]|uniref:MASE1 domain-containing protein n=1 Tax=Sandarakinorhabdus rubra TaxID=2672568 RepID=UPI0013DB72A3|nr:MASE1 domain-containing protein [Sandarakinorhabdus rubra]
MQPFLAVRPWPTAPPAWTETLLLNLGVALAYFATGMAGLKLAFVGDVVTLFWPPTGIAFAALWMGGRRLVWGVIAGAFAVNAFQMAHWPFAALVALGNALPALVATIILRSRIEQRMRATGEPGELWRVLLFILIAALGSTTLSATVGTLAVGAAGAANSAVSSAWLVWWMGDAMGVLIVAPPILLWDRYLRHRPRLRDVADAAAFAMAGVGIIAGLLLINNPIWAVELCKLFTLLLSLWAGARFGLTGPAAVTLLMAAGGVGVTLLGVGPFKRESFYDSFALLHSYLFAEAIAGMLLAAALADLRRTVRAERVARSAAERASSDRIRLLTMISHDVRTPLAGMMGVLQQFERSPMTAEQQRLTGLGLRAGRVLTTLVTDILDVARADAGRIVLNPAPFSPAQSIGDVMEIVAEPAAAKGIALSAVGQDRLPRQVLGDRARFEQVLGNLVTNAINYTSAGSVSIAVGWHQGAPLPLVMEISDTGPGIPPDRVPNLFDAFVLEPKPGNRSTGLGLGLHICRRLVELMGGSITYRAPPTGGSQFRIELPLPAIVAPDSPGMVVADPPRRILLVEDDPIAATVTTSLLASHGHHVITAASTESAIDALVQETPDLVLMDISIGGDNEGGLVAVRRIRALGGQASLVSLVALTAHGAREDHARYLAAGLDAVLVKPLALEDGLAATLARATTLESLDV